MSFEFDDKHNVGYEEDEFEFFDLNSEDGLDTQTNVDLNIGSDNSQSKKKNKKKSKFSFGSKKKGNDPSDFIMLDEVATEGEEFVILSDGTNTTSAIKNKIKLVFGIILVCLLTFATYFLMSYQLINEDIKGTEYNLGSFSVVSRNYQPNLDELKVGDKIICENKKLNWLPFVVKYDKLTYKSRNGVVIFAEDEEGNRCKIQSVNVDFIAR